MRNQQDLEDFLAQIHAKNITTANLTPGAVETLRQLGYGQEADARMQEIKKEEALLASRVEAKFDDGSATTQKNHPKIEPDELGNAETRGHSLVEENGSSVIVNEPNEPTVELGLGDVFALGGNEDELDVIPTRLTARLPASPDEPTLRELELADFEEDEDVNVGNAPPPIPLPAAVPQRLPPAALLGNSWSQEAPTTPRAPALQQRRRCFNANLNDIVLVLGATVMTVVLGTTFFELGRSRERSFWQKLFAERPVVEKTCGEPTVVVIDEYRPPQPDVRAVVASPVQKPLPKIRRPTTVVRRPPPPSRPVVVEVPAVMGTYPLPAAGSARDSVLATLKRACGSDPKWVTDNTERLSDQRPTTIRAVCREDMATRLPQFVPVGGYPPIPLKIRQS